MFCSSYNTYGINRNNRKKYTSIPCGITLESHLFPEKHFHLCTIRHRIHLHPCYQSFFCPVTILCLIFHNCISIFYPFQKAAEFLTVKPAFPCVPIYIMTAEILLEQTFEHEFPAAIICKPQPRTLLCCFHKLFHSPTGLFTYYRRLSSSYFYSKASRYTHQFFINRVSLQQVLHKIFPVQKAAPLQIGFQIFKCLFFCIVQNI